MDKLVKKCLLTDEEYTQAMKDAEQEWMWNRSGKTLGRARAEYEAKFTAQILKAIPIISEEYEGKLEVIRTQVAELTKKLDDREADLINAKREASEEIKRELEEIGERDGVWLCLHEDKLQDYWRKRGVK